MSSLLKINAHGQGIDDYALSQLRELDVLSAKEEEAAASYLSYARIRSLGELSIEMLMSYRQYIKEMHMGADKEKHYGALLERIALIYLRPFYPDLCGKIEALFPGDYLRGPRNKLEMFLMLEKVHDPSAITYNHRQCYLQYLTDSSCIKILEYVKLLDRLKLSSIEADQRKASLPGRKLIYTDDVIYLGYHPDIRIAREFYNVVDKKELVFDFSFPAPGKMKRQIFAVL